MPEVGDLTKEGAAEGRFDNWGEVVTRQPYRKVRLDHLLSKEEITSFVWNNPTKTEEITSFVWNNPTKTEEEVK